MTCIRAQYLKGMVDQGAKFSRQNSFLVEQGHDSLFFQSVRSVRGAHNSKLEIELTKQLATARLDRARDKGQQGYYTSDAAPRRGAADA